MASITYNGVSLPFPLHTSFQQEAVYDEVGQTDRIYTKFDITVQALINTDYQSSIIAGIAANSPPSTIMKAIRQRLLQQRKQLVITSNGVDLIPAAMTGNAGTIDAKNGPQPQYCHITALTEETYLISWKVIAHYWENNTLATPNVNDPGDNVLFNRWTEDVTIDECNYSKIHRNGTFAIRSDNLSADMADDLRAEMANVSIPDGFKRESARYTVSPDGLRLHYDIVDKEVFRQPPKPAFKAEGTYRETTTLYGFNRTGTISLTLTGSKESTQTDLLNAAIQIAVFKMSTGVLGTNARLSIFQQGDIEIQLYENRVKVSMTCWMPPAVGNSTPPSNATLPENVQKIQNAWTTNRIINEEAHAGTGPPAVGLRGNTNGANWLLRAAAFYDPSIPNHSLGIDRQVTPNDGQIGTTG